MALPGRGWRSRRLTASPVGQARHVSACHSGRGFHREKKIKVCGPGSGGVESLALEHENLIPHRDGRTSHEPGSSRLWTALHTARRQDSLSPADKNLCHFREGQRPNKARNATDWGLTPFIRSQHGPQSRFQNSPSANRSIPSPWWHSWHFLAVEAGGEARRTRLIASARQEPSDPASFASGESSIQP